MRCIMLIASVAALGFGTASAVAVPRSEGTVRYAQLRLYGESGCSAKNLGELGIYNGDINKCHTFGDDVIKSIDYEYSYKEGCSLRVYSDLECHLTRHDVVAKECLSGDKEYKSYELVCKP